MLFRQEIGNVFISLAVKACHEWKVTFLSGELVTADSCAITYVNKE
jgi:hypothetical protein